MQQHFEVQQTNPELRALVVEASEALARLDSARLQELALSCEALNRGLECLDGRVREDLARQARGAAADMAVFARVLEATRANLKVMNRLRDLRRGRLEYTELQARCGARAGAPSMGPGRWGESVEAADGDD